MNFDDNVYFLSFFLFFDNSVLMQVHQLQQMFHFGVGCI